MSSGSGMASGIWADTSCLRVETRYSPGGTSPGSASGNCSTDLGREGWSSSLRDRRHSESAIEPHGLETLCFLWQRTETTNKSVNLVNAICLWNKQYHATIFIRATWRHAGKMVVLGIVVFLMLFTDCSTRVEGSVAMTRRNNRNIKNKAVFFLLNTSQNSHVCLLEINKRNNMFS